MFHGTDRITNTRTRCDFGTDACDLDAGWMVYAPRRQAPECGARYRPAASVRRSRGVEISPLSYEFVGRRCEDYSNVRGVIWIFRRWGIRQRQRGLRSVRGWTAVMDSNGSGMCMGLSKLIRYDYFSEVSICHYFRLLAGYLLKIVNSKINDFKLTGNILLNNYDLYFLKLLIKLKNK